MTDSPRGSPTSAADSQLPSTQIGATDVGGTVDDTKGSGRRGSENARSESAYAEGSAVGPYRLVAKIGEGGMGTVWKAVHAKLEKTVALKLLPDRLLANAQAIARFEREMKAAGRVVHPNVVQAFDAGEVNGTYFLAMEYVEGANLHAVVRKRGPLSVQHACRAVRQAALGLAAAHAGGMVHRDVKPMNLLLSRTGVVKVLDLGLARLAEDAAADASRSGLTADGQVMGTPDYMAAEQWENTHAVGPAADLYALGCTLFYLLTGRAPYGDEQHISPVRKMAGHVNEPPPDLAVERPDAPAGLCELYRRLMAKRPEDRPGSAEELATELARFTSLKAERDGSAPGHSTAGSATAASGSTEAIDPGLAAFFSALTQPEATVAVTSPATVDRPASGTGWRSKWLLISGGSAFAAVVLLGIFVLSRSDKKRETGIEASAGIVTSPNVDKAVSAAALSETALDRDPVRQALLRAFKMGARVSFEDASGTRWIHTPEALPEGPISQNSVGYLLLSNTFFDGTMVDRLLGLAPTTLAISATRVVDADLAAIRNTFPKLQSLDLAKLPITDAGLANLSGWKTLAVLDLSHTGITDAGLTSLKEVPLTQLTLDHTLAGDEAIQALRGSSVEHLSLARTQVTDAGIAELRHLPKLMSLNLQATNVTDAGLAHLADCHRLTTLNLAGTSAGDVCLSSLVSLPLTTLNLDGTHVTDAGLAHVGRYTNLQSLTLSRTAVTSTGLGHLRGGKLGILHVSGCTEVRSVEPLASSELHAIWIDGTGVTDLSPLRNLPLVEILLDFDEARDADVLRRIQTLTSINQQPAADFWQTVEPRN